MVSRRGSNQYSSRMRLNAKRFGEKASERVRTAALAALETLVFTAPVDTSKLVSNFIVTLDGPNRGVIEARALGKNGSTADRSRSITFNEGFATIETFDINTHNDIFITNNTPYLRFQAALDKQGAFLAAKAALTIPKGRGRGR